MRNIILIFILTVFIAVFVVLGKSVHLFTIAVDNIPSLKGVTRKTNMRKNGNLVGAHIVIFYIAKIIQIPTVRLIKDISHFKINVENSCSAFYIGYNRVCEKCLCINGRITTTWLFNRIIGFRISDVCNRIAHFRSDFNCHICTVRNAYRFTIFHLNLFFKLRAFQNNLTLLGIKVEGQRLCRISRSQDRYCRKEHNHHNESEQQYCFAHSRFFHHFHRYCPPLIES